MTRKSKLYFRLSIILLACLFSFFAGQISRDKNSPTPTPGLHLCSHVTDGDTIKVIFRGLTEKLRILDIDAPEVRRTDKLRKQAMKAGLSEEAMLERGQEARRVLESMVLGRHIQLQFEDADTIRRDGFDRLLCHVSVDGTNIASHLLSLGLVEVYGE